MCTSVLLIKHYSKQRKRAIIPVHFDKERPWRRHLGSSLAFISWTSHRERHVPPPEDLPANPFNIILAQFNTLNTRNELPTMHQYKITWYFAPQVMTYHRSASGQVTSKEYKYRAVPGLRVQFPSFKSLKNILRKSSSWQVPPFRRSSEVGSLHLFHSAVFLNSLVFTSPCNFPKMIFLLVSKVGEVHLLASSCMWPRACV